MLCELKASAITNLIYGIIIILIITLIMYMRMPELLTAIWTNNPGRVVGLLTILYIGRVAFDMTLLHFNNKCVQPKDTQYKTV